MRNVLVGFTNISFGIFQALFPIVVYLFVMPRLFTTYESLGVSYPNVLLINSILLFLFAYGVLNVLLGALLLSKRFGNDKLFIWNIILMFLNFIFGVLVSGILMIMLIGPMYTIGSDIQ